MVTSRLALGSVSTLAVGALVLGAAPLLLNHAWGTGSSAPWGAISSFSGNLSTSTPSDGDRSQLLKLAALKSGHTEDAQPDPAMAAAAQLSVAPAPTTPPSPAVDPAPAPVSAVAAGTDSTAASAPSETPVLMAAAEPEAADAAPENVVPLPPVAPTRSASLLININRAPSETLDHFPGAGHIGHAIVSHRPYRSIADLVRRRVLRTSDFQKIQGRISVD